MFRKSFFSIACGTGVLLAVAGCSETQTVSFKRDVAPILNRYCAECHTGNGEGFEKSGFEVGSYDAVMKGTKFGPVIVAGDPTSSSLYRLITGQVDKSIRMPHGKEGLAQEETKVFRSWIEQGAKNN